MANLNETDARFLTESYDQLPPELQSLAKIKLQAYQDQQHYAGKPLFPTYDLEQRTERDAQESWWIDGKEPAEIAAKFSQIPDQKPVGRRLQLLQQMTGVPASDIALKPGAYRNAAAQAWGNPAVATDDAAFDAEATKQFKKQRDARWLLEGNGRDDDASKALNDGAMMSHVLQSAKDGKGAGESFADWQAKNIERPEYTAVQGKDLFSEYKKAHDAASWQVVKLQSAADTIYDELAGQMQSNDPRVDTSKLTPLIEGMSPGERSMVGEMIQKKMEKLAGLGKENTISAGEKGGMQKVLEAFGRPFGNLLESNAASMTNVAVGVRENYQYKAGQAVSAELANDPAALVSHEIGKTQTSIFAGMSGDLSGMSGIDFSHQVALTAEQAAAANAEVDKQRRELNTRKYLLDVAQGTIDPVKGNNWASRMGLGSLNVVSSMASFAMPGGAMANTVAYIEDERARLENAGVDAKTAALQSVTVGSVQGVLDKVELSLFMKLPKLGSVLTALAKPSAGALASVGGRLLAQGLPTAALEGVVEGAQDATPLLVQKTLVALGADEPGVQWNEIGREAWASTSETFMSMLPLVLIGVGIGGMKDFKQTQKLVSDKASLSMLGFSEEQISTITGAGDVKAQVKALNAIWDQRTPIYTVAQNATEQAANDAIQDPTAPMAQKAPAARYKAGMTAFQQARQEHQATADDFATAGIGIRRDEQPDGSTVWKVRDTESGVTTQHPDYDSAWQMASHHMTENLIARSEPFMAALQQYMQVMPAGREMVVTNESGNLLKNLEDATDAGDAKAMRDIWDRAQVQRQRGGQTPLVEDLENEDSRAALAQWTVLGKSYTEFQGKVGRSVATVLGDGNVIDMVEEMAESDIKEFIGQSGQRADVVRNAIAHIEQITGDTYMIGEGETALVEAWSSIVRLYATGVSRQDGNAITKGAQRGIKDDWKQKYRRLKRLEASGVEPAFFARLKEYFQLFKATMARVSRIMRAKAEGKLDADVESMIRSSIGMNEMHDHAQEVDTVDQEENPAEFPPRWREDQSGENPSTTMSLGETIPVTPTEMMTYIRDATTAVSEALTAAFPEGVDFPKRQRPVNPVAGSMVSPPRLSIIDHDYSMPDGIKFANLEQFMERIAREVGRMVAFSAANPGMAQAALKFYSGMGDAAYELANGDFDKADLFLRWFAYLSPRSSVISNAAKAIGAGVSGETSEFSPGVKAGTFKQISGMGIILQEWMSGESFGMHLSGVDNKVRNFYLNGASELLDRAGREKASDETLLKLGKKLASSLQTSLATRGGVVVKVESVKDLPALSAELHRLVTSDMWDQASLGNVRAGFMFSKADSYKWVVPGRGTVVTLDSAEGQRVLDWHKKEGENAKRKAKAKGEENEYDEDDTGGDGVTGWGDLSWQELESLDYDESAGTIRVFEAADDGEKFLAAKGEGPIYDVSQAIGGTIADAINAMGGLAGKKRWTAYNVQEFRWGMEKTGNPRKANRDFSSYDEVVSGLKELAKYLENGGVQQDIDAAVAGGTMTRKQADVALENLDSSTNVATLKSLMAKLGKSPRFVGSLAASEYAYALQARQLIPFEIGSQKGGDLYRVILEKLKKDKKVTDDDLIARMVVPGFALGLQNAAQAAGLPILIRSAETGTGSYEATMSPQITLEVSGPRWATKLFNQSIGLALEQTGANLIRNPTLGEISAGAPLTTVVQVRIGEDATDAQIGDFMAEMGQIPDSNGDTSGGFLGGHTTIRDADGERVVAIHGGFYKTGDFLVETTKVMPQIDSAAQRIFGPDSQVQTTERIVETYEHDPTQKYEHPLQGGEGETDGGIKQNRSKRKTVETVSIGRQAESGIRAFFLRSIAGAAARRKKPVTSGKDAQDVLGEFVSHIENYFAFRSKRVPKLAPETKQAVGISNPKEALVALSARAIAEGLDNPRSLGLASLLWDLAQRVQRGGIGDVQIKASMTSPEMRDANSALLERVAFKSQREVDKRRVKVEADMRKAATSTEASESERDIQKAASLAEVPAGETAPQKVKREKALEKAIADIPLKKAAREKALEKDIAAALKAVMPGKGVILQGGGKYSVPTGFAALPLEDGSVLLVNKRRAEDDHGDNWREAAVEAQKKKTGIRVYLETLAPVAGAYGYAVTTTLDGQVSRAEVITEEVGRRLIGELEADETEGVADDVAPEAKSTFALSPSDLLENLAGQAAARIADPQLRLEAWARIHDQLLGMARAVAHNDAVTGSVSRIQIERERRLRQRTGLAQAFADLDTQMESLTEDVYLENIAPNPFLASLFNYTPGRAPRGKMRSQESASKRRDIGNNYDGADAVPSVFFGGTQSPAELAGDLTVPEFFQKIVQELGGNEDLIEYGNQKAEARQRVEAEANAWADAEIAALPTRGPAQEARDRRRFMGTLDYILAQFPAEVRVRVGGFAQLADLDTNAKRANWIKNRIERLEKVLEPFLQKEFTTAMDNLVTRAGADREGGKKPTGKLGGAGHAYFEQAEAARAMTQEEVVGAKATIAEEALNDKITPAEALALWEREQILDTYGNWENRTAAEMSRAYEAALDVYKTARNRRKEVEAARVAEVNEIAAMLVETLGDPSYTQTQAQKKAAKKLRKMLKFGILDLKSFSEVLTELVGAEHPVARRWSDAARRGMAQKTDGVRATNRRWKAALYQATGMRGVKARRQLWDMGNEFSMRITKALATVRKEASVPVTLIDKWIDGTADFNSLGISPAEADRLMDDRRAMTDKDKRKLLPYETVERVGQETVEMTEAEGVFLTMLAAQEGYKEALEKAGWDAQALQDVSDSLSPAAKELQNFMAREYQDGYAPLAALFEQMFGVNLPQLKNYSPGAFYHLGADKPVDPTNSGSVDGGMRAGALLTRKKHRAVPKLENAFGKFMSHVQQMEHWKALAPLAREINGVLGKPEVKRAIEGAHGEGMVQVLAQWSRVIEGNGLAREGGFADRILSNLTSAQSYIALAWKIGTLLKQSSALLGAAWKIPPTAYLRGMSKLLTGQLDVATIYNTDFIQRRLEGGFAPEVRAAMNDIWNAKPTRRRALLEAGMELIGLTDALFTTGSAAIAYDFYYNQAREAKLPPDAARALAMEETERMVNETAQPVEVTDRSLVELRMNSFGKLLFLFASEARQKSSLVLSAWQKTLTGNATPSDVKVLILAHLIVGPFIQAITSMLRDARDDDDDEIFDAENWNPMDFLKAAALGPLSGIPIIGAALSGYKDEGILGRFLRAGKSAKQVVEGPPDTEDEPVEWYVNRVSSVLQGLSAELGVLGNVANQTFDIGDNLVDDDVEEAGMAKRQRTEERKESRAPGK